MTQTLTGSQTAEADADAEKWSQKGLISMLVSPAAAMAVDRAAPGDYFKA